MKKTKESAIGHVKGENYIDYFTSEKKYLKKLRKYMAEHPGAVEVRKQDDDGGLLVRLPESWFRSPAPPKKKHHQEET